MFNRRICSVIILLTTFVLSVFAANQTKALCYSGSTLYQQITQNCNDKDPSYTGEWYCAKIEVCEANISPQRQCIVTRGCATQQECVSSGATYDNTELLISGQKPAGMTMKATCCQANNFPSDDTAAIDYSKICNSASRSSFQTFGVMVALLAVSAFLFQM